MMKINLAWWSGGKEKPIIFRHQSLLGKNFFLPGPACKDWIHIVILYLINDPFWSRDLNLIIFMVVLAMKYVIELQQGLA
jgi:hypothetical protein